MADMTDDHAKLYRDRTLAAVANSEDPSGPAAATAKLYEAADAVEAAKAALDAAREAQRDAIRAASKAGMAETQIAAQGRVNRMTVRAALGK